MEIIFVKNSVLYLNKSYVIAVTRCNMLLIIDFQLNLLICALKIINLSDLYQSLTEGWL